MDPISGTEKEQKQKQQSVVLLATDNTTTAAAVSEVIVPSWCIFVKTVGKGFDDRRVRDEIADTNDTTNKPTNSSITRPRSSSVDGSFSFDVRVNPEDQIDCLHDEIEAVTGVKASQQRLIYRGRLIGKSDVVVAPAAPAPTNSNTENNSNYKEKSDALTSTSCKPQQEYKIKDIIGLCDGQTIHLVRKRDNSSDAAAAAMDEGNTLNNHNHSNNNDNDNDDSGTESDTGGGGGGGGGALLAALLGLSETRLSEGLSEGLSEDGGGGSPGSSTRGPVSPLLARPDSNNRNTTSNPATPTATATNNRSVGSMWRSSRATTANNNDAGETTATTATSSSSSRSLARHNNQNQNRRPHYRLGTEDLGVADPGSMESVRQGLMTLNTIMNSQPPTHPQQNNYTNDHHHRSSNIPSGLGTVGEEGSGQQQSQFHHRHHHHPLEVNREWFRGQWIDARDTVNQWLEATVVDILDPKDVLDDTGTVASTLRDTNGNRIPISTNAIHARRYWSQPQQELQQPQAQQPQPQPQPRQRRVPNVDNDPAISANDLHGRRRLLLEECEPGDPREITIGGNTGGNANHNNNANDNANNTESDQSVSTLQLPQVVTHHGTNSNTNMNSSQSQSFRPRASNSNGVKLLLIHYNGWPHRWDEWIRSDSERLRPFRTRTRHPNTSSMTSPTPQSIFNEAPRTNIIEDGDEEEDRFAVLPELNTALSQVSELLGALVQRERGRDDNNSNNNQNKDDLDEDDELEDLRPLNARNANNNNSNVYHHEQRATADLPWMARYAEEDNDHSNETTAAVAAAHEPEHATAANDGLPSTSCNARNMYNQGELRNLATLLDRLGRTLTDVAPHIASIAGSLPSEEHASERQNAPATTENSNSYDSAPLRGLLSLWSRERERARRNNNNTDDQENATTARPTTSAATVDPDHIDFASGIVNTTRGEVRSGPRNRASHQDDVASLLGTYLAAASLGSAVGVGSNDDTNASGATSSLARLLQRGSGSGSGDNGIDIHIHAIVTAPGVSPGGMGIATLSSSGGSPTATLGGARNLFSSNRNSLRADGGILRSGASMASNNNFVEPTNEEDYSDLFSELYSESPTPIDPNGSPVRGENNESIASSAAAAATDDGGGGDTTGPDNICTPGNNLSNHIEQQQQLDSTGDASLMTPPSNRSRPSPRRPSSSRGSGVFRLFRRRGSRANNPDGSNNEDTT